MNKQTFKSIAFLLTYGLLLAYVLFHLQQVGNVLSVFWSIIFPIVLGGGIAFILNIPMRIIEKNYISLVKNPKMKKKSRIISLLITLLLFIVVLLILFFSIIPELAKTVKAISDQLPEFIANVQNWLETKNLGWENIVNYLDSMEINLETIRKDFLDVLGNSLKNGFTSAFGIFTSVVGKITNGVLAFIFSIYFLFSKEEIAKKLKRLLYAKSDIEKADKTIEIFKMADKTFSNFFAGQCLEALILGSMFVVAMTLFRMPYALLIGMVISVTALIPMVGAFIGMVVGSFLIVMVNPMQALWFIILFLVLQQIEGNLIYPRVVGNSVGLPSLWVLIAVVLGGGLMGIVGMILFIPLVSLMYAISGEYIETRLKAKNVTKEKWS